MPLMLQEPLEATTATGTILMSSQKQPKRMVVVWAVWQCPELVKQWGTRADPAFPFLAAHGGRMDQHWGLGWHFSKWPCLQNPLPQAQRPHWWLLLHGGSQVHLPCNLGRQTHTCFLHKLLHFLSCLYGWSFWLFVWCLKVRILERPIHLMEASEVLRNIGGPLLTVQIPSWSKRISTLVR